MHEKQNDAPERAPVSAGGGAVDAEVAEMHERARQAQAQGSEGDRESLVREVIDLARKLEPWDGKTFNEELHTKLRKLVAAHAQAGEGSNNG